MSTTITDRELVDLLLEHSQSLTEREAEAFDSFDDQLCSGRKLSPKQREWAVNVCEAHGLIVESSRNLHSAGLVPNGTPPKTLTPGEIVAKAVLNNRPLSPPGRRSA